MFRSTQFCSTQFCSTQFRSIRFRTCLLILLAAALLSFAGPPAHAGSPSYLVIRSPHAPRHHGSPYPAHAIPVYRQPYAYGFFGAASRHHWTKHHGYYRNFTQWSAR